MHQWKLLCFIETITTCRYNEAWERCAVTKLVSQRKATVGSIYRLLLKSVPVYLKIFRKPPWSIEGSIKIFYLKSTSQIMSPCFMYCI